MECTSCNIIITHRERIVLAVQICHGDIKRQLPEAGHDSTWRAGVDARHLDPDADAHLLVTPGVVLDLRGGAVHTASEAHAPAALQGHETRTVTTGRFTGFATAPTDGHAASGCALTRVIITRGSGPVSSTWWLHA
jgi:hypothetical protein